MPNELFDSGGGRIRNLTPPPKEDLINLSGYKGKNIRLRNEAALAYKIMLIAAQGELGISGDVFKIVSGYRDPNKQKKLWKNALLKFGSAEKARKWVAPPGKSTHQTGSTIDLYLGVPVGSKFVDEQKQTDAYKWLIINAHRYGFYPYEREPWHWEFNPPKINKFIFDKLPNIPNPLNLLPFFR